MGKIKEIIEDKVLDTSIDHETHKIYRKDCSSCWTKNMRSRKSVEEILNDNNRAFNQTIFGCSPWDKNPLE